MAYRTWAAEQGTIKPWTQKALSTRLSDRGYEKKVSGVAIWYGIGLLAPEEPTEAGGLEGLKPNSKAKLEGSEILAPSSPHVRSRAHREGVREMPPNPPTLRLVNTACSCLRDAWDQADVSTPACPGCGKSIRCRECHGCRHCADAQRRGGARDG
ncbi:MAG: hypothetical protein C1O27_002534 [Chloroflexi bacterium]|jgi:hypothetical protein|nr:MAG: hypothetical protein C1O27_002534 [Chloroflexota bacterium]